MENTVGQTYTTVADFQANVPKFNLSDLNLHIVIQPEGMTNEIHVLAKRPTVEVLDGMQRMLKETSADTTTRIRDIIEFQLIPLLLAWNCVGADGEIVPFEVEPIIKQVPADVINVLVTSISSAVSRPVGVPDPNVPESP